MNETDLLNRRIQELEKELAEVRETHKHDLYTLRTPLTPMQGFINILLNDEKEEWYAREDRREFYSIINENIERMSSNFEEIINGGVGLTRYDSSHLAWQENIDSRAIIEEVIAVQQKRTDNCQTIVIDFEPDTVLLDTAPDHFASMFHNLIGEAINTSSNGGEIRINGCVEAQSKEYPSGALLIQVRDWGRGLSKTEIARLQGYITAGFPKCNPVHFGAYLLGIVIAKLHHGEFWVESEGVDKGTACFVRIPLKQPQEKPVGIE